MGTTLAALHVKCDNGPGLQDKLVGAFQKTGWVPADEGVPDASVRRVAVSRAADGKFATIVISGNDRIDDGTLKELAVALSHAGAMPAIFTGINDSDAFDVMLFHNGQQIDALGDAAADPGNDLKQLSVDTRSQVWSQIFGQTLGAAPDVTGMPSADAAVGSVLSWIGFEPATAFLNYSEAAQLVGSSHDSFLLTLVPAAVPGVPGSQRPDGAQPVLTVFHDDDDCPHHRVYPAHWPLTAGKTSSFKWLIVSSGAGFDGATVEFRTDDLSGGAIQLTGLTMHAYPFFNGQVMSGAAPATYETALSVKLEEGVWSHDAPSFAMPDLDPEAGKRLVIILRVECIAENGAKARLRPQFLPVSPGADALELPPLRIVGGHVDWQPCGSNASPHGDVYTERLLLEINTPSVLSLVAIMDGDTEAIRASAQLAAESWLGSLSPSTDCTAAVLTKKHMSASGSITKKRLELPLPELTGDRAWKRWFSGKTDLHTLRVEIRPEGAFQPYAGFVMQSALREDTVAEELPPSEDAALHIAFWTIDQPEAWTALGIDQTAWLERLECWIEASNILQAHRFSTAWIPAFDAYEDYEPTIYEELSGVDWFRRGHQRERMTKPWCEKTLRFVAPRMWLSGSLMARLSLGSSTLDGIAAVSRTGRISRISLDDNASIAALERALSPILPAAQ